MALSAHALTTVDAVKLELGLPTGVVHADDGYFESRVNIYSGLIERYCHRHFERSTIAAERHVADGQMMLALERSPLVTLTSISFDGTAVDSTTYEIADSEAGLVRMIYDAYDTSNIARNVGGDPLPGTGRKLYTVAYTGGYVLPKDDGVGVPPAVRDLPYELEEACVLAVVTAYRGRGRDRALISERLLSWSGTYAEPTTGGSGLPPEVEAKLVLFRRICL